MKKRLLSLVIAICIVVAMLPVVAVSASALEVNETISYYFCAHTTNSDIPAKGAINTYAENYNETTGRYWKYLGASTGIAKKSPVMTGRINGDTRKVNQFIALNIYVPEDGTYETKYYYYKMYNDGSIQGGKGDVYILPEGTEIPTSNNATIKSEDVRTKYNGIEIASGVDYSAGDASVEGVVENPVVEENIELKKGDNILLFVVTGSGEYVNIDDNSSNTDYNTYPTSLTLTLTAKAPAEDEELKAAFNAVEDTETITSYDVGTVSAVAYTVGTDAQDSTIAVEAKDNEDGTYTLNAPAYEGYNFLYWKKGLTDKKDVITYKPTDFVYAPTAGENNYVIAVYEKIGESTANKAEFYNANGQFIASTNGTFPTEIPSMAGYGDATGWQCYTDGETYGLTGSVTPSGIMLFVANYKDTLDTVTVNDQPVPYGTEITFTAKPETDKKFKCWKRTDKDGNEEIVSIEENYKFCAYEDCTIEEVDADSDVVLPANTRKIVLDTFRTGTATALMAEFIGFKNDTVVEKGIMFENNRIAMKSTGTQFTIIPDENGTYKGYAIIETDDGYTLITDGSYPESAE